MGLKNVKKDFPIFANYPDLVYLDSAATSQKPTLVLNAVSDFYTKSNSNIHRGIYDLSVKATQIFEESRLKVSKFIGASNPKEIIFTGNASEAINLVAIGFAKKFLKSGDIVVTSETEHHSNFVPWLRLKNEIGIKLCFLPMTEDYELDYKKIQTFKPLSKIKLVALSHVSNVLGMVNPVLEITAFLKKNKIKAKVLIDGAQATPHIPVNLKRLGCDFYAFSSHKMLGPSGVGVLWAREEILEEMEPVFVGSNMISTVSSKKAIWADLPQKFEVGTQRLEAVVGLGAAVDYLSRLGMKNVQSYEKKLAEYTLGRLEGIKGLKLFGKTKPEGRLGVFSFAVGNIHPHDIGEILNRGNICIRTGHHCAQPLMKLLGVYGTSRASLYIYNDKKDIDRFVEGIMEVKKIFKI